MAWWIPLAAAAAQVAGGMHGNQQARGESQRSRQWQERMSNTAVRRRMADMRAAGINPILAAQGQGASVGSGGMAAQQNPVPADFANSAKTAALLNAQIKEAEGRASVQDYEGKVADLKSKGLDAVEGLIDQLLSNSAGPSGGSSVGSSNAMKDGIMAMIYNSPYFGKGLRKKYGGSKVKGKKDTGTGKTKGKGTTVAPVGDLSKQQKRRFYQLQESTKKRLGVKRLNQTQINDLLKRVRNGN